MMHRLDTRHGRALPLYLTGEHACSYLDGVQARTLFVDPGARIDGATYQTLIDQGFRRSGAHVYRPACRGCSACIPVRLPVAAFAPNRSQRRTWRLNAAEITWRDGPAAFCAEQFELYRRYLAARHADGAMAEDATEDSYRRFLVESWGGMTRFIEFRLDGRLVGVAVTDVLEQGLSAVYTFFDPELGERALGTFGVLTQIRIAQLLGRPYLYLGYWIAASRKMIYKERFRPIEAWDGQRWRRFDRAQALGFDGA
jgi:leucyl-tRNA---protein transferase